MAKKYLVLTAVLVILSVGIAAYWFTRNDKPAPAGTGIKGAVLLGPTCSVQKADGAQGHTCDDHPYQTGLVVTTSDQSTVIKQFNSDQNGAFSVPLPPGEYAIRSAAAADILPYCSSGTITVTAGHLTSTTVICDTGIR